MTPLNALFTAVYAYLLLLCLKQAVGGKGNARGICLIAAALTLPSAMFLHFAGGWDFSAAGLNDPAAWWVAKIPDPAGGGTRRVNVILAVFVLSLVYIAASLAVALITRLYDRRGSHVNAIYRALVKWGIVLAGAVLYLGAQGISLTPLFLGMGAVSLVVGLALQETLANLFTGLALDMEGVVKRGAWIQVDGGLTGRVIDKGWRATRLQTLSDELVVIPNKLMSGGRVLSLSHPTPAHARTLEVSASYADPPVKVKEILRQILLRDGRVLDRPPPAVFVSGYGDSAIRYRLMFWISDHALHLDVEDAILTRVWYAFREDGVEIPYPVRTVIRKDLPERREETERREGELEELSAFLGGLPVLAAHLSRAETELLARNAKLREYGPGEPVLRRGEAGDWVYFVKGGTCEVELPGGAKKALGVGEYFGEMSLFRHGPRTADVLAGPGGARTVRLDRESLGGVFAAHPELRAAFARTHEVRSEESGLGAEPSGGARPTLSARLASGARRWLVPW